MRQSLGHCKILDQIGAGGIGEVYRARDMQLGRTGGDRSGRPLGARSDRAEGVVEDARERLRIRGDVAAGLRSVAAVLDVRSGDRAPPAYAPMHVRRASSSRWLTLALVAAVALIAALIWFATRVP